MKRSSLKREFFAAVTVTLLIAAALSALTVWGCLGLRRRLVPDTHYVMLHMDLKLRDGQTDRTSMRYEIDGEAQAFNFFRWDGSDAASFEDLAEGMRFSVESVDYGTGQNGPLRKAAYLAAGAAMGVLPAAYALAGTLICALWFYRKRLAPAIAALDGAARHIREQDLDFTVACPLRNELGGLCASFEEMRRALYDNNLRLWRAMEERRTIQASVAHDLRNPLAIMEGLLEHLRDESQAGALTGEALKASLAELDAAAKRMERYTDYIRDLDALEDTEILPRETAVPDFLREAAGSVGVLAQARGLAVEAGFDVPEGRIWLDREIFYRALENLVSNAVRYARSRVALEFALQGEVLTLRVSDDGPGFSAKMLQRKTSLYCSEDPAGEHMGLGLATSRILVEKHGGSLRLANVPSGGALVELTLAVNTRKLR